MRAEQTVLPSAAATQGFAMRLVRTLSHILRSWSNRRAMRQLNELTEWELVDIGLTREDIALAYDGPILDDPTRRLAQIARERAKEDNATRRHP
jgi:Domain of unknown function (DUF1127).